MPSPSKIPEYVLDPNKLVNKSIVLYGATGSGKTLIIKDILYELRNNVDQVLLISPTEMTNNAYEGIIPKPCKHPRLYLPDPEKGKKKENPTTCAKLFLSKLLERQEILTSLYRSANSHENLDQLLRRIDRKYRAECAQYIDKISSYKRHFRHKVEKKKIPDTQKLEYYEKIEELCDGLMKDVKKKYLRKDHKYLTKLHDSGKLSEAEKQCYEYKDSNPNIVVIFDDCAADIVNIVKTDLFRQLFYQGRHYSITVIMSCQDDTDLPANIRKQAHINMFTQSNTSKSNFTRESNKYDPDIVKIAIEATSYAFSATYRKLVYSRVENKFYAFKATTHKPFKFGSSALWELCEKIEDDGKSINKSNPFFKKFVT